MAKRTKTAAIRKALQPYLASDGPSDSGWWDAFCPLHEDDKRSAGFNFEENRWRCHGGCGAGKLTDLVAGLVEDQSSEPAIGNGFADPDATLASVTDIRTRKKRSNRKAELPNEAQVQGWSSALIDDTDRYKEFRKLRGLKRAILGRFQVGWNGSRYTIPIRDADGTLLNVRLYNPDGDPKMYHLPGYPFQELYPANQLDNDALVICEGEFDTLMAIQNGFPAITGITGAGNWNSKWNGKFSGKTVYLCYDRDVAGEVGANKAAMNLSKVAKAVYIAELPLPFSEKHGQDVTDFFKRHKKTKQDFKKVLSSAKLYSENNAGIPVEVSLRNSYDPGNVGKPVSMTVTIVGKDTSPHTVAKTVEYSCGVDQGKICTNCPMNDLKGHTIRTIDPSDKVLLEMRGMKDKQLYEPLRGVIGAHKCGAMAFDRKDFYNLTTLSVRSSVDSQDEREGDTSTRHIVMVSEEDIKTNQTVRVIGTNYPSPQTQESIFLAWDLKPVETSLDRFTLTAADKTKLEKFKVEEGQTPIEKLEEIAEDFAANVTRITGRPDLHMVQDLVWHSLIDFNFNGRPIERGWLEALVVGDSRTGKSEVARKLAKHYGVGRVISLESASIPGILGAVKPQSGGNKGWTLEWGAIPVNDRRLLVLDEASGLSTDQISQLSSLRSSGIAEIVKSETWTTLARCRMIWLSNPRANREGMERYMYGVHAIGPLIGNHEDIARFDIAMSVASDDVPSEMINKVVNEKDKVPHVYDSESCHLLLKLVWSRKRDQVIWEKGAEELIMRYAMKMGREYMADPPLVQPANIREKIARFAPAIAARLASFDKDWENIFVTKDHVVAAVTIMNRTYRKEGFGYHQESQRIKQDKQEANHNMDEAKKYLRGNSPLASFFLRSGGIFRRQTMEEMLNISREEANAIINKLSGWSMIRSENAWEYRMTSHFNYVIKELRDERRK